MLRRDNSLWSEANDMSVDISLKISENHPEWDEDDLIEYRRELRDELYWELCKSRYEKYP